jgi:hypothetical protein
MNLMSYFTYCLDFAGKSYGTTAKLFMWILQGYSKRSIHFQKFILQLLLNIWRHAIYRLKGDRSKLFSHLTSTRCEPHMWRGRCQIDNPALPTLLAACRRWQKPQPQWCAASDHRYQNFERDFLSIRTQDMVLASVVFVKQFLKVYTSLWITLYIDYQFELWFRVRTGILLLVTASSPAVGSNQTPNQWVPGALSPEQIRGASSWPLTSV